MQNKNREEQVYMAGTKTGLDEKIAGMLCYILGWVSGIVFLIIEPDNKNIRFHALQSIIVFGALTVVNLIFSWIPIFGTIINVVTGVLAFVLWLILLVKTSQGDKYMVKWAGVYADKLNGSKAE